MRARNRIENPLPGDSVPHVDGGRMYVYLRTPKMVCIARHSDDLMTLGLNRKWIRLSTFKKLIPAARQEGT